MFGIVLGSVGFLIFRLFFLNNGNKTLTEIQTKQNLVIFVLWWRQQAILAVLPGLARGVAKGFL